MVRGSMLTAIVLGCTAIGLGADPAPAEKTLPPIGERIIAKESQEVPVFRRHVVPLMGKLGCNGRACHGSFQGQGGFRLSLFGYDFKMDHENLTKGEEPRADVESPAESLMLEKPTLAMPHKGGKRMEVGGWEYTVLLKWIAGGAKGVEKGQGELERVEVTPSEIVQVEKGKTVPLRAVAVWTDGTREDVTSLCRFQSNDEQIATINGNGVVTAGDEGDTHVVVFYDNAVVPVPVLRPVNSQIAAKYPEVAAPTEIDKLVVNKLRKLGVVPSGLCTDAEFLRRVSLDITGSLPTASEVEAFLADTSADKRTKKIDELLERPTYIAWWTTRLCDITGNNDDALVNVTPQRPQASQDWYDWIYKRVENNTPYDELVAGIVLATSRKPDQPYIDYVKELSDLYRPGSEMSFADQDSLTHFWARRTVQQPAQKALSFAHTFLGIRIQCAECHKHPFDQWTQDDYKSFTQFFQRVSYGTSPELRKVNAELVKELGVDGKKGNDLRKEFPRLLKEGKTIPFSEVFVAKPRKADMDAPAKGGKKARKKAAKAEQRTAVIAAKPGELPKQDVAVAAVSSDAEVKTEASAKASESKPEVPASAPEAKPATPPQKARKGKKNPLPANPNQPKLLGGDFVDLSKYDDPRTALMDWLREKDNPYFARSFVNRVWAGYFHVGIVEPADDLSLANPPSNRELLDYLAEGFIDHNYDMKWLHREITNSRTYQLSWTPNETNRHDQRNFSHAIPRRLPAEVAYDAIHQAGASDEQAAKMQTTEVKGRAIALPGAGRRFNPKEAGYALSVFGRSSRESNCDCDRSDEPTLLQTVYLRNDRDVLTMLDSNPEGWLTEVAEKFSPEPKKVKQAAKKKAADAKEEQQPAKPTKPAKPDKALTAEERLERLKKIVVNQQENGEVKAARRTQEKIDVLMKSIAEKNKNNPAKQKQAIQVAAEPAAAPVAAKPVIKIPAEEADRLIRQAYLRSLSRYPSDEEFTRSRQYLNESADTIEGVRDLLWALLNTKEFIVNH